MTEQNAPSEPASTDPTPRDDEVEKEAPNDEVTDDPAPAEITDTGDLDQGDDQ